MKSVAIGIFWILLFPAAWFTQRTASLAPSYRKVRFGLGREEAAVLARDHLAAGFEGEGR